MHKLIKAIMRSRKMILHSPKLINKILMKMINKLKKLMKNNKLVHKSSILNKFRIKIIKFMSMKNKMSILISISSPKKTNYTK
jgi:hypothetical protein